jgi:hypothetical protein
LIHAAIYSDGSRGETDEEWMADEKLMLTPYLSFNGNTAEAMRFYQLVIGGELKMETFEDAKVSHGAR